MREAISTPQCFDFLEKGKNVTWATGAQAYSV